MANLIAGDRAWILPAVAIAVLGVFATLWFNRQRLAILGMATCFRIVGWLLVVACLVNPLWSSSRPRRGANVFAVVTDVSRSHQVAGTTVRSRGEEFVALLEEGENTESGGWLDHLDQDFELRRYVVSDRLERVDVFGTPTFEGSASNLQTALTQLMQRFSNQPLAGVLLLSDGNATDLSDVLLNLTGMAPIYPVLVDMLHARPDIAVGSVSTTQTAFDDAPVTILVQLKSSNTGSLKAQVTLKDDANTLLETQTRDLTDDSPLRFRVRPETVGTVFYTVHAALIDEDGNTCEDEATLVNNVRLVAVDRGSQPRRVLYVSGRPNWEYKFLRRSVETDPQIDFIGLIRIAKKEAKFDFRGHTGEQANSIFRGFDKTEQELAEEYDEPVLVRLGISDDDPDELIGGFPEDEKELFRYDAIILDDIEAEFFMADQLQLIYKFVSKRGGGFLMAGGQESFRQGEYDHTPVGEILPIDLHSEGRSPGGSVRLNLTRDGWLQPWIRLRNDEASESRRLQQMPEFRTINAASFIRPGAIVMSEVTDSAGSSWPALVVQRFGRGRAAALCVADLWRWRMNDGLRKLRDNDAMVLPGMTPDLIEPGGEPEEDLSDHARACRQMIRWLVADVPRRLDASVREAPDLGLGSWRLSARLKGPDFEAREDARVRFHVTRPDGTETELLGEPSEEEIGRFDVVVSALTPGPYMAEVSAVLSATQDQDEEELSASIGWASQPDQEEMASVTVNRRFLQHVANSTGGRIIKGEDVNSFVDGLSAADAPIVEITTWSVWHQWWVFILAVCCFISDWTIRRRQGMP